ncbi:hypothetical protein SAMN05519105_1063 [Rhodobacter sp. 24-YEA-8]|nr:hypothetical protein SAMN05519105_1063 [Rhodobacter sp. 24-YEA-8]
MIGPAISKTPSAIRGRFSFSHSFANVRAGWPIRAVLRLRGWASSFRLASGRPHLTDNLLTLVNQVNDALRPRPPFIVREHCASSFLNAVARGIRKKLGRAMANVDVIAATYSRTHYPDQDKSADLVRLQSCDNDYDLAAYTTSL